MLVAVNTTLSPHILILVPIKLNHFRSEIVLLCSYHADKQIAYEWSSKTISHANRLAAVICISSTDNYLIRGTRPSRIIDTFTIGMESQFRST